MPRLPVCSGEEAIRVFEKAGWQVDRQRESHVSMFKEGVSVVLTILLHIKNWTRSSYEVGPLY